MAFEYFDIPYRYNETTIKLLFQNPTTLYIFWDVADCEEQQFIDKYGIDAYNNSRLYLKLYNISKGYDFELNIDSFAKSWYINNVEPNCKYKVELFRKINNENLFITGSNMLKIPTDTPCYNNDYGFEFINRDTNQVEFVENINVAINSINNIDTYKELVEIELEDSTIKGKKNIKYNILRNPSSFSNISSGTRYTNN